MRTTSKFMSSPALHSALDPVEVWPTCIFAGQKWRENIQTDKWRENIQTDTAPSILNLATILLRISASLFLHYHSAKLRIVPTTAH